MLRCRVWWTRTRIRTRTRADVRTLLRRCLECKLTNIWLKLLPIRFILWFWVILNSLTDNWWLRLCLICRLEYRLWVCSTEMHYEINWKLNVKQFWPKPKLGNVLSCLLRGPSLETVKELRMKIKGLKYRGEKLLRKQKYLQRDQTETT